MEFNTIGIIGAMDVEIELIIENMNNFVCEQHGLFKFYNGTLNRTQLVVVKSGAGKVNASSCTQLLIDKYSVDCIINTGIAGSMSKDLEICDLVISNDVTYHDVRPGLMRDFFPFKEVFNADERLIELLKNAIERIKEKAWNYHIGRIVSGDRFIDNQGDKERIAKCYNPLCVEMEGAAIGHVCYLNSVPFAVVRSISDKADDNATETYEEFEKKAAIQSGKIIVELLK